MPCTGLTPAESLAQIKIQRAAQLVAKMHANFEPVMAYVEQQRQLKGETLNVLEIPEDSAARGMGYRYCAVPYSDVERHLKNGCTAGV